MTFNLSHRYSVALIRKSWLLVSALQVWFSIPTPQVSHSLSVSQVWRSVFAFSLPRWVEEVVADPAWHQGSSPGRRLPTQSFGSPRCELCAHRCDGGLFRLVACSFYTGLCLFQHSIMNYLFGDPGFSKSHSELSLGGDRFFWFISLVAERKGTKNTIFFQYVDSYRLPLSFGQKQQFKENVRENIFCLLLQPEDWLIVIEEITLR